MLEYEQLPLLPEIFMFSNYSPSKLKTLQKCPLQFYLRYVLKYSPELIPENDTTARDTGKMLHSILEFSVKGIQLDKAISVTRETHDATDEFWSTNVVPNLPNVETFLHKLDKFTAHHGITKVYTELKTGVTKDWKKTTFFDPDVHMRGIIDLLLVGSNRAFIIDHKKGGTASYGLRNYMAQLDVYKPFTLALFDDVDHVAAGIHFIEEGSVSLEPCLMTRDHIIQSIIPVIDYQILEAERAVRETGFFKHYRGAHCKYCDFDADCKAKKLLTLEKESGKLL